ncbi:NYN domain-containing protein [Nocardioides sediminis]|uniref:NYN domain-containing protein n=1 Tax=Nocardioides sediminis TaxID=433648 RepID=UPI000D3046B5|nr:NYN domain-containing protein [Nocardioides sediminis]
MTHVEEWPPATRQGSLVTEPKVSLSALVRRWLAVSDDLEQQDRGGPSRGQRGGDASAALDPALVAPESTVEYPERVVDPQGAAALGLDEGQDREGVARVALPRRRRGRTRPQLARRLAVLIDARVVTAESADEVFDLLADHGSVNVAPAYGDWSSPEGQELMPRLRHHGIQPCHQFAPAHGRAQDERSLVALTVDAVDLARDDAVDAVVLVGDLTSAYPLVQRLNAAGVAVMAFGPSDSPEDVRGMCEEFTDLELLHSAPAPSAGRHRA